MATLLRKPSAFIPVGLSLAAVTVLIVHITLYGTARQADEGTAAHLWQLCMSAQVPLVAFFVIRWLPEDPRRAWPVLALQIGAAITALAPVLLLGF
ncbi:MAG: hypothetical protein ABIS06_00440 [Vicinamibacterales bacterium]